MVPETYRSRLDHVMSDQGRTNLWLAKKAGVSRQAIQLYRAGIRSPSLKVAVKIVKALGVPIEEIAEDG